MDDYFLKNASMEILVKLNLARLIEDFVFTKTFNHTQIVLQLESYER